VESNSRLEDQRAALTARLSQFPGIEIASCGTHANSVKHWFRICHTQSQRWFSVDSMDASDFSSPIFLNLLESFVEECNGGSR
jgi:hypothetical protein